MTIKHPAVISLLAVIGLIASMFLAEVKVFGDESASNSPGKRAPAQRQTIRSGKTGARSAAEQKEHGKALFSAYGCLDCHKINGKGCKDGIDLSDVGSRRTAKFLFEQIKDPEGHVKKNQRAFNFDTSVMADEDLSSKEIATIVVYLHSLKSPKTKAPRSTLLER